MKNCTFETDLCDWINGGNLNENEVGWLRRMGETPSHSTGPVAGYGGSGMECLILLLTVCLAVGHVLLCICSHVLLVVVCLSICLEISMWPYLQLPLQEEVGFIITFKTSVPA